MNTKLLHTLLLIFISSWAVAQTTITGTVSDNKGATIPGANIYIKDTFDGTNSRPDGSFSFRTEEKGDLVLMVSFIGFKTKELPIQVNGTTLDLKISLVEEINKIDGVTISAGAYESSDIKKITVLKPLDIVTTASAVGDIFGALNTLPGTTPVGESGRLFVRGGEGYETKVFIDGLEVRNAFGATAPNVPTRGRFSPFLFKGTVFSTGGYSAEYGQALSSALVLNSNDLAEQTESEISLMSVGGDVAHTQRWENTSVSAKVQYTDLRPYQDLVRQEFDWERAPVGKVGEFVFRHKPSKTGLFKVYANFDRSDFIIRQPNINSGQKDTIDLKNDYHYVNASYQEILGDKWSIRSGISFGANGEDILFNAFRINEKENSYHLKTTLNWDASEKFSLNMGAEHFHKEFTRKLDDSSNPSSQFSFDENITAVFGEADYFVSNALVVRAGLRGERNSLTDQVVVNPRVSMAYKLPNHGQFSFAYGRFHQSVQNDFAIVNSDLRPEQATHYILNYQYIHENRVFRIEGYQKDYDQLVKYTDVNSFDPAEYNNNGTGQARGIDIFWRDGKTFKNTDYWVSYSFVDATRDYQDFTVSATPQFVSKHNFSWVVKHFVNPLRTQFGATLSYSTGRPFHNPNREGFQNDQTPAFQDLSLNAAILLKQNIILYLSSSNVLGRDNVFGYQYANTLNSNGFYDRQPIRQGAKRFLFLGLFITLSKDGQKNQLDNL